MKARYSFGKVSTMIAVLQICDIGRPDYINKAYKTLKGRVHQRRLSSDYL